MRTREFDETIIQTPSENSRGLATGKTPFSVASGLIVRPSFNLYFLMYTQIYRSALFEDYIPFVADCLSCRNTLIKTKRI